MGEYVSILRNNRDYRYLWLGFVVSLLGDWFNLIASVSLIANLTGSGTDISLLFLARFLPLFVFSPLAGVLADLFNRRHIMILSDLLRAATVLAMLLVRDAGDIWLLYLLTVIQFTLSAIFTPARSAIFANIVQPENLVAANALDSATWSAMLAIGSLAGGIVAALFGVREAFIMDAATFLLSAWLISRISSSVRQFEHKPTSGGLLQFVDGIKYLWGVPILLGVSLVKGFGSLVWGSMNVIEITYAEEIFPLNVPRLTELFPNLDGGTLTLGIIYAAAGLGTGFGPILMRRWLGDAPAQLRRGIGYGFALMTAGIAMVALSPTLPLLAISTLIRTIGTGTVWVLSAALLQLFTPDHVRGRVFGFEFAFLTLTQSLSILWAGVAQDQIGFDVRQIAAIMSVAGIAVGALWLLFQRRTKGHALTTQRRRAGASSI